MLNAEVLERERIDSIAIAVELQQLPVRGLAYRWGVDFAGPMPTTKRGNKYVLVMIEHFTKWVEFSAPT